MNETSPYALLLLEQRIAKLEKELRENDERYQKMFETARLVSNDTIAKMNLIDEIMVALEEKVFPGSVADFDALYKIIKGHSKRTSHLDMRRSSKQHGLPRKSD